NRAMSSLVDVLRMAAGTENVLITPADLAPYARDATAGYAQIPVAVVFPGDAAQVAAVVRICQQHHAPVVPRGGGTSLSGGAVPVPGAVVLGLHKLNKILEVDPLNLTMLVEPGVITERIDEAAAAHGLFYPPDPGSIKTSTIGGNVASNAGGLRGIKYGVTRDYVLALEVVLPNGEVAWLGSKCRKDVAGYSLHELFIGSEGTLGVITKILLKLLPRPAAKAAVLATYRTLEDALATASAIIAARLLPCTLEFLDQTTLRCVEAQVKIGLPVDAGALLLMETDGHPVAVAEEAAKMAELAHAHGAIEVRQARDAAEADRLTSARRMAYTALAQSAPTAILEDVTVPRSELVAMVRKIEKITQLHDVKCAIFGHAGDGNFHPTYLTDEGDAQAMARVRAAATEIAVETLKLGGTVSGEHGIGLSKKAYLPLQRDVASYTLLKQIKRTIDPGNLLNPGKIFDL
ncbi:MAG TPA: FAD-linked oxidase C-terminal domain-containing protein, partial [Opitutales bacterium]|nr:FAD-linked oxidase C-terminal domain-containing protein [Opitutales bacterium]